MVPFSSLDAGFIDIFGFGWVLLSGYDRISLGYWVAEVNVMDIYLTRKVEYKQWKKISFASHPLWLKRFCVGCASCLNPPSLALSI